MKSKSISKIESIKKNIKMHPINKIINLFNDELMSPDFNPINITIKIPNIAPNQALRCPQKSQQNIIKGKNLLFRKKDTIIPVIIKFPNPNDPETLAMRPNATPSVRAFTIVEEEDVIPKGGYRIIAITQCTNIIFNKIMQKFSNDISREYM